MDTEATGIEGVSVPAKVFTDQGAYLDTVYKGISGDVIRQAIKAMGNNRALFLRLLEVDSANLSRVFKKKHLGRTDTEEVLDTLRIYREAVRIFESHEVARDWLSSPIRALSDRAPEELCDTFEGRSLVRATLRKIEQGDFS
nr:antitoxin Xre/MbcA/ParS toxin-binding domain-containing protein [uncultured Halomonas sp.]